MAHMVLPPQLPAVRVLIVPSNETARRPKMSPKDIFGPVPRRRLAFIPPDRQGEESFRPKVLAMLKTDGRINDGFIEKLRFWGRRGRYLERRATS